MASAHAKDDPREIFENMPVSAALAKMALPSIVSQLITLIYNIADTWFIGQTNNPYMVAASSIVLTIFIINISISNLFAVGGGTLMVRLMGAKREGEARKVASFSLVMAAVSALLFSLLCLVFMDPLLKQLGASSNTIGYAKQYLFFVVVIGAMPTVLSSVMSTMVRNAGYSKEAGFGLSMGGVLNVVLDPIFMFVLLPDGYEVMGAAIATMLSNVAVLIYFIRMYKKLGEKSVLELPRRMERIDSASLRSMFSVGVPAAASTFLYDMTTMVINRLSSAHGDIELAAIGIVLKVERLPINVGIGICLGMVPLAAYNYASKNYKRMNSFFSAGRLSGLVICLFSVVLYRLFASQIVRIFIADANTVRLGTQFLKARCFATPFMFLSFNIVHFMQAINMGKVSFQFAVIRQICFNIPILFIMNYIMGMSGIVWTQTIADFLTVVCSYIIYFRVMKKLGINIKATA